MISIATCGSGPLAAMVFPNNRAEGRRSHRVTCSITTCGSGLLAAMVFPNNRAEGRRSHNDFYHHLWERPPGRDGFP